MTALLTVAAGRRHYAETPVNGMAFGVKKMLRSGDLRIVLRVKHDFPATWALRAKSPWRRMARIGRGESRMHRDRSIGSRSAVRQVQAGVSDATGSLGPWLHLRPWVDLRVARSGKLRSMQPIDPRVANTRHRCVAGDQDSVPAGLTIRSFRFVDTAPVCRFGILS